MSASTSDHLVPGDLSAAMWRSRFGRAVFAISLVLGMGVFSVVCLATTTFVERGGSASVLGPAMVITVLGGTLTLGIAITARSLVLTPTARQVRRRARRILRRPPARMASVACSLLGVGAVVVGAVIPILTGPALAVATAAFLAPLAILSPLAESRPTLRIALVALAAVTVGFVAALSGTSVLPWLPALVLIPLLPIGAAAALGGLVIQRSRQADHDGVRRLLGGPLGFLAPANAIAMVARPAGEPDLARRAAAAAATSGGPSLGLALTLAEDGHLAQARTLLKAEAIGDPPNLAAAVALVELDLAEAADLDRLATLAKETADWATRSRAGADLRALTDANLVRALVAAGDVVMAGHHTDTLDIDRLSPLARAAVAHRLWHAWVGVDEHRARTWSEVATTSDPRGWIGSLVRAGSPPEPIILP